MEHTLSFQKTFRYELLNDISDATTVLYVLHGYGQLAKFFIQKFKALGQDILIVAPEGMHRFYQKGNSGRVGASWMTREAREVDIADNMDWLTALDEKISTTYPINNRLVLGFSQGGSTAVRWRLSNKVAFDSLVVWGSDFPPEEKNAKEQLTGDTTNYLVIGNNDEYFDDTQRSKLIDDYKSLGFKISTYIGHHDIDTQTLIDLIQQIQEKL
jgi:predicted esterase